MSKPTPLTIVILALVVLTITLPLTWVSVSWDQWHSEGMALLLSGRID